MTIPAEKDALRDAFLEQRSYTLALYQDLPANYWESPRFPYSKLTNPPIWELAHIAWFAEFFCCRWRPDDIDGLRMPSIWEDADRFLNSSLVAHDDRWHLPYPDRAFITQYMEGALRRVLDELSSGDVARTPLFQLALLHEDMHGEALVMTRKTLGLPVPSIPFLENEPQQSADGRQLKFSGGRFQLGARTQGYQFDNELPPLEVEIGPFEMDGQPVSSADFAAWKGQPLAAAEWGHAFACHVDYADAAAYARALGRRLPTEAEWEFACIRSSDFQASTGQVWEWTSSRFEPRPGFVPGAYLDYSRTSFPTLAGDGSEFRVLKGGSFATHPRLKYPQYRNFYATSRTDMFCGFRTCRSW